MTSAFARTIPATLALATLLVLSGLAPRESVAQVAVPTIVPVSPSLSGSPGVVSAGFVTLNPAAMQWGAPSRLGAGGGEGEIKPESGDKTDYRAWFGGARLVGESFSIAGEAIAVRDTKGPYDFAIDTGAGAIAARPFSPLVVGIGYASQDNREGLFESTQTSWSGGGSYRFGEWLYLGGAYGQDKLEVKDKSDPLTTYKFDGDRAFWMGGAGIRYGGTLRVHLEYYFVNREPFEDQGVKFSEVNSQAGVAEVGLGPVALGFKAVHNDEKTNGTSQKTDTQAYDAAFAPMLGLAIGVRFETSEEKDEASNTKTKTNLTAVTLAYQF